MVGEINRQVEQEIMDVGDIISAFIVGNENSGGCTTINVH